MNSQRALSSQSCSTSAPSSAFPRAHHPIWCNASSSDAARPDSRHRQPFGKGYSTGCYVQRPPPQLVSGRNGVGPAVMQGLGTPLPNQHSEVVQKNLPGSYDVTEFVAETLLPTRTGKYRLRGYRHTFDGGRTFTEPSVIMTGRPENGTEIPVRVHDACFTSEVLGSLKCDCAGQLEMAMDYIQENGPGLIIYLQQEGRGIGLANKIAAYALQEEGLDTVDANRALGLPDDCREYSSVRNILQNLGIRSIRLMTNNPRKMKVLEELGVVVTARIPCIVKAQEHNMGYIATKQARMSHWMDDGPDSLDGSYCYWNHDGETLKPSARGGQEGSSRRQASNPMMGWVDQPFLGPAQGLTRTSFAEQWIINNVEINDAAETWLSGDYGMYDLYKAESAEANKPPISLIAFSKKIETFVRTRNSSFLKKRDNRGAIIEGVGLTEEASQREVARVRNRARLEEEARLHKINEGAGLPTPPQPLHSNGKLIGRPAVP